VLLFIHLWLRKGGVKLTLVDISLGVVGGLIHLVSDGVLGGGGAAADAGIVVFGDGLVGFLGCLGAGSLDGLGNVVGGVLRSYVLVR